MSAKKLRPKLVSGNARPRGEWVKRIAAAWQDGLKSIFETGVLLESAKAELEHGEWEKMVKDELPFARNTAHRLITIADNDQLRDMAYRPHLPISWRTLYELTKVDANTFSAAIADGRINPKMQQKDAVALHRKPRPQTPTGYNDPVGDCVMVMQDKIEALLPSLQVEQRAQLFSMIRQLVSTLEGEQS